VIKTFLKIYNHKSVGLYFLTTSINSFSSLTFKTIYAWCAVVISFPSFVLQIPRTSKWSSMPVLCVASQIIVCPLLLPLPFISANFFNGILQTILMSF
jgi:hypothetical protein